MITQVTSGWKKIYSGIPQRGGRALYGGDKNVILLTRLELKSKTQPTCPGVRVSFPIPLLNSAGLKVGDSMVCEIDCMAGLAHVYRTNEKGKGYTLSLSSKRRAYFRQKIDKEFDNFLFPDEKEKTHETTATKIVPCDIEFPVGRGEIRRQ